MFRRSSLKKQELQAIAQASGHNLISFKAMHGGCLVILLYKHQYETMMYFLIIAKKKEHVIRLQFFALPNWNQCN